MPTAFNADTHEEWVSDSRYEFSFGALPPTRPARDTHRR